MSDEVRDYYGAMGEKEWQRLERPEGVVELAVTTHFLAAHLPPRGRVLDLGGGPGRYSQWLVERGYETVLSDLSPALLDIARARLSTAGVEIVEADARDLSRWGDASFDAVLSLGPMYHLPLPADRERAARELARVMKVGGVAFVAWMPRYAFLRRTLANAAEQHRLTREFVRPLLDSGSFTGPAPGRFTHGYGARPQEIEPFMRAHGFQMRELIACEGIASGIEHTFAPLAEQDPARFAVALQMIIETAADPVILGFASHLLYIGEKSPGSPTTSRS
jgi:SAM-dependent methyltransferase